MKNSLIVLIALVLSFYNVRAQYDAQASQYMFVPEVFNPASVTANDRFNLMGLYRLQWIGMDGAPQTLFFHASAPLHLLKHDHGVGVMFENDKAGMFSTQGVYAQYAFKYKLKKHVLSFGLNLGFMNQSISSDSLNMLEGLDDYHQGSDPVIPTGSVNAPAFDIGVGAMFRSKSYYFGVSAFHLTKPMFDLDDNVSSSVSPVMYFTGGYAYKLPNNRFVILADAMVKTDFAAYQVDVSARVEIDDLYYLGLNLRPWNAVSFLGGVSLNNGLSIGYSFDLSTTQLISRTYGSHEVYLRYSFLLGGKKNNKYKSVRIL